MRLLVQGVSRETDVFEINITLHYITGSVVVKALGCKSVGPEIVSKRWQLTIPCALGSTQPLKMSTRIFLGVKAAGE